MINLRAIRQRPRVIINIFISRFGSLECFPCFPHRPRWNVEKIFIFTRVGCGGGKIFPPFFYSTPDVLEIVPRSQTFTPPVLSVSFSFTVMGAEFLADRIGFWWCWWVKCASWSNFELLTSTTSSSLKLHTPSCSGCVSVWGNRCVVVGIEEMDSTMRIEPSPSSSDDVFSLFFVPSCVCRVGQNR